MIEPHFFQRQMMRLAETFGNTYYKDERLRLIRQEVEDLGPEWLKKTVDYFIGECRQAPLVPEFREEIAKERERLYRIEKSKNSAEAIEAIKSLYSGDDVKTICGQIVLKIKGSLKEHDFMCFKKMLTPPGMFKCNKCQDTGVYFEEGFTVCNHF